jgi:inner membrane protein
VDNLTHSLVGLAAAKAGLERTSPYATPLCVLAANLPDVDLVTLLAGRYVYLEQHRGVSHSIAGTLALSLTLPLLFYGGERLAARVRGRTPRAKLTGRLFCSLALGASHSLLDWTNNYGVRPLLPWDGRWIYGDLVFIIDPWIWLMLGGAAFLLTEKTRWKTAAWACLALVLTAGILWLPGRRGVEIPLFYRALWLAALGGLFLAHRMRLAARWGRAIAAAALSLVVVYWGALSLIHARAAASAHRVAQSLAAGGGERLSRVAAMPMPADPLSWRCVAETEGATYRFDLAFLAGDGADVGNVQRYEKPRGEAAELVRRASGDPRARIFLDFARFPVTSVRRGTGGAVVQFVDVRFTEPGEQARGGTFALEIPVN